MEVLQIQRNPFPTGNFSVEILSQQIKDNQPGDITPHTHVVKYHSQGILKRLFITLEVLLKKKEINHIMGDINFAAMFLPSSRTILTVLDVAAIGRSNRLLHFVLNLFWLQIPVRRAAWITTISESTKTELLKLVRIPESKVHVINIPVSKWAVYSPKQFNSENPTILHIGTGPNKNLLRVAKALSGIKCKLDIIGALSETQLSELHVNKIEFENHVSISSDEMKMRFENADLLLFPSTYEGFGMPIVEAQLIGRPVITSNNSSMPEVAGDGAILVDPLRIQEIQNAVNRIITDEQLRNELVEKGRKNAERFDAKVIGLQYAELYRKVYRSLNETS